MKQRLTSLCDFEQALLGSKPIVLLFASEYCHACHVFERRLSKMVNSSSDIIYFELRRGDIPGLEKTFHLMETPAMVSISAKKQIIVDRHCDQLTDQTLKTRLEELE